MTNPNHTDTSRSGDLVERLREALQKIAGLSRWETMTQGCNAATDAVSIARAALGEK